MQRLDEATSRWDVGALGSVPGGFRPWEDRSLSPEERFTSYKTVVADEVAGLSIVASKLSDPEFESFSLRPATLDLLAHAEQLAKMTADEFCWLRDGGLARHLMGSNFLGAEEWRAQGIEVGEAPPIPSVITAGLLNAACPFHPGEKISDTHLLVLVPKTVNEKPYSPRELHALCATRQGSGEQLIRNVWWKPWKYDAWAMEQQQESTWVLLPKRDPDPDRCDPDPTKRKGKHFRNKAMDEQQRVLNEHYPDYRGMSAIELMTALVLNDLTNKGPRMLDGDHLLRCTNRHLLLYRVAVGKFGPDGLGVSDCLGIEALSTMGLALARKV